MMAIRRYAQETKTSSADSRADIERVLGRHGARAFTYGWDDDERTALVAFRMRGRTIKFSLPLPDRSSTEFTHTPIEKKRRSVEAAEGAYDQAVRQRWRALLLIIKAKLEAVESGVVTLEDEFLSQTMLGNGSTVGEWAGPQIDEVYRTGGMPSLLPGAEHKALTPPHEG